MAKFAKSKPLAREEIRLCDLCGARHEVPGVYRIRLEAHQLDNRAIMQTAGLEMHFGGGAQGAVLASIMGSHSDFSKPMNEVEVMVCHNCVTGSALLQEVFTRMCNQKDPTEVVD